MKDNLVRILRYATFFVFLGRGWQHVFQDAPFRALFWNESLLKGFVESVFDTTWHEYVTHPSTDPVIQKVIIAFGWFYFLCAIFTLLAKEEKKIYGYFLISGSVALVFLSFLYFLDRLNQLAMFLEHAAQFSAPLLLYWLIYKEANLKKLLLVVKLAIAITFVSHGLYAAGYFYARPGVFVDMVIISLNVTESTAHVILTIAAYMDFALAIFIFIPKIAKPFLIYAIIWGFLTAMARVVANFYFEFALDTITYWLPHVFYRFPHFLLPLAAYFLEKKQGKAASGKS